MTMRPSPTLKSKRRRSRRGEQEREWAIWQDVGACFEVLCDLDGGN